MYVDIYSKRNVQRQAMTIYDDMSIYLRNQIIHIWRDTIGVFRITRDFLGGVSHSPSNEIWTLIHDTLCREYGVFALSDKGVTHFDKCIYFLQDSELEHAISITELSFRAIDRIVRKWDGSRQKNAAVKQSADEAIQELNFRFREHGFGYQYVDGLIIRVDTEYLYDEAVNPAIELLNDYSFSGASQEFMSAHAHYRHMRYKEAVNDALKAFESTMKTICKRMDWAFSETDPANKLIVTCFRNRLIPEHLQSHFTGLRTTLESGLPTIRNKQTGHGQGEIPQELPQHFAAYALHLAATNIVFLMESYKQISQSD